MKKLFVAFIVLTLVVTVSSFVGSSTSDNQRVQNTELLAMNTSTVSVEAIAMNPVFFCNYTCTCPNCHHVDYYTCVPWGDTLFNCPQCWVTFRSVVCTKICGWLE